VRSFAFRLCLAIGCPHPDYLLSLLTSHQLAEWIAYFEIHRFGQDYTDGLIAQQLAQFFNANKGQSQRPRSPDDYLSKKEQDPEDMELALRRALSGNR